MKKVIGFTKIRIIMFIVSIVLIGCLGIGTLIRGQFNLGIDFVGGLNMQVQLAQVALTIKYEGTGSIETKILGGILSIKVKKEIGENTYDFNFQNYSTVRELTEDLEKVNDLKIELLKYADKSPEQIISKDYITTLYPGDSLRVHMPVQNKDEMFATIEDVRSALVSIPGVKPQTIGNILNQEYMLKVRAQDVIYEETETPPEPSVEEYGDKVIDGNDEEITVPVEASDSQEKKAELDRLENRVKSLLANSFDAKNILINKRDYVGPSFSQELLLGALWSILLAFVLILIYISFRFKFGYAIAAICALIHDVLIMLGVIGTMQLEVTATTIAAVLTIIGYSLNDTIVVFDRIRENSSLLRDQDRESIVNTSITQSLSRTLITSLTTLLAVLSIYIFGTGLIKDFAFKLIVGIVVGTYSSIFIASPIYLSWQNFFEKRKKRKQETATTVKKSKGKQLKEKNEKDKTQENVASEKKEVDPQEEAGVKATVQERPKKKKKKKKKKKR